MAIDVSEFVDAAGGEVVGKIRFQKMVYLLDQLGLNSGFDFDYHHYGPYSAELADTIEVETIFGHLSEDSRRRQSDGVPYSVFKFTGDHSSSAVGGLTASEMSKFSGILDRYSATTLELAATAYWLVHEEGFDDWRSELIERKGVKTRNGRIEEAIQLLDELGLSIGN